jgi:ABC-type antimicrobial peptide transport system permease subunit
MFWILRTQGDPTTLATRLAGEVRRIDPEVAASQIRPLARYLSDAVAPRRFNVSLLAAFAVAALVLAITGIYAVVMYSVSQRAREIGIRMALGARRSSIVRLVMGHGIRAIVIGLVAGTAMAAGATRLLAAMLFGVAATDAATFVQVAAIVATMSVFACVVPAARAARAAISVLTAE